MDIILATRNPSKALQIQTLFAGSRFAIKTQAQAGIEGEAVEDSGSLEANALKKVQFVHERVPDASAMADDTGLFIDAIGSEPGVEAAYWGGADLTTDERMRYCLDRFSGASDRSATFRTVVAVMSPQGEVRMFVGEVRGALLAAPRVSPQPNMPYSALFIPEREATSWAEMSTEYENTVSHRGKAFRQVREFLESFG